jgi:hypothetical protein
MNEMASAAVGALITGLLGVWLLPIWREARRTGPHSTDLPDYCRRQSPNRLIFRFFQWVYWGEVPLIKAPIELLEERLKRPPTLASGMITKSEGAVYRFEPMPVFNSMLNKLPLIGMTIFVVFLIWMISVLIATSILGIGHPLELFEGGMKLFFLSVACTFAVAFILSPLTENALVVLVQDKTIRIRWLTAEPVQALPEWRITTDADQPFTIKRLFGSVTLVEVCTDGVWQPACRPKWISFQLSRLVEQDQDWKRAFADFQALLSEDLGTAHAVPHLDAPV